MFLVLNHNDICHGPTNSLCLDYEPVEKKKTSRLYDSCCNEYSGIYKFNELEFIIVGYNQLGLLGQQYSQGNLSSSDIGM